MVDEQDGFARETRITPAAAILGIVFALLLATAFVLVQSAMPANGGLTKWFGRAPHRRAVGLAEGLILAHPLRRDRVPLAQRPASDQVPRLSHCDGLRPGRHVQPAVDALDV